MPLKLSVGLTRKMGLPAYGSLGASCQLEVELDPHLVFSDIPTLQQRIRYLHGICRQAVEDELALRQESSAHEPRSVDSRPQEANGSDPHLPADQEAERTARASQRQLDYVLQLARQVPAVGVAGLPRLAQHLFQKTPAELTCLEASSLIDVLKDLRGGKLSLKDTLPGAAA
jgi:hypothetical protein